MAEKNNFLKIGNKLRKLRYSKGYSQEYMADVLKISQKTYSNMENDKTSISIETLKKISEEYNIDLLDIISDEKVVIQHNNSHDTSSFQGGIIINQLSEELISQFKERIEDLKKVIENKNKLIAVLEKN